MSEEIERRSEELARTIVAGGGKPIFWARGEVHRAASTFRWAAEEARRYTGELSFSTPNPVVRVDSR